MRLDTQRGLRLAALGALLVGACGGLTESGAVNCAPGAEQICVCPGNGEGVQVCSDDGSQWQTCNNCVKDSICICKHAITIQGLIIPVDLGLDEVMVRAVIGIYT